MPGLCAAYANLKGRHGLASVSIDKISQMARCGTPASDSLPDCCSDSILQAAIIAAKLLVFVRQVVQVEFLKTLMVWSEDKVQSGGHADAPVHPKPVK